METYKYVVCVNCMTYNHALYIEDTLDGFCIQDTNFPFVCCIIDDASTDGEPEIIEKYLNNNFDTNDKTVVIKEETTDYKLIFARHNCNRNCFFLVLYLKYNHYKKKDKYQYISKWLNSAKYVAFCEGDDYWINKDKLQKQADALEAHPDCSIAYCKAQMITKTGEYINGRTIPRDSILKEGVLKLKDILKKEFYDGYWVFHTSTFLHRSELTLGPEGKSEFMSAFPYGDMPWQLWCLLHGNGYFVDILGSCYRLQSGGYSSYVSSHSEFAIEQQKKLISALNYLDELTEKKYHKYLSVGILRAQQRIDNRQGHAYYIFKPKYWPLLRRMRIGTILSTLLMIISPNAYTIARNRWVHMKLQQK